MPKTYLRGLTQREESQEGVDFFAQLPRASRVYAFQFKAPKGRSEGERYRFTIQRRQHSKLSALASGSPGSVYYVLPFYTSHAKLRKEVPNLLQDTWFLRVAAMGEASVFGSCQTKTLRCNRGTASVNPNYELQRGSELEREPGISVVRFAEWYANLRDWGDDSNNRRERRNPWLVRGLRVAIVLHEGAQSHQRKGKAG
ncbi:MAG: hypothetical protein OXH83_08640 [Bryobacterales bacterium]|nr:hypothetical protein [Bryobacterales bacterium]